MVYNKQGYKKPKYMDSEVIGNVGSHFTEQDTSIAKTLMLGKVAQMEDEDAVETLSYILQGVQKPAGSTVVNLTGYQVSNDNGKTSVTVSSIEAFNTMLSQGYTLIAEVPVQHKL